MKAMNKGFTLTELLVTVGIVAILALIAIPSYKSYMIKSRRADAKEALAALQLAQEKWRGNNTTYSSSLTELGISSTSTGGYYTIGLTAEKSTGTNYEGTATAISTGLQAADTCGVLKVGPNGFSGDSTCWGLK